MTTMLSRLPIGIASDHGGRHLKAAIIDLLKQRGFILKDFGVAQNQPDSVDYPDYAQALCRSLTAGDIDRGILVCGSGIGMSIAANRFPGVRATLVWNEDSTHLARRHNHSNVLCLGERLLDPILALKLVEIWLDEETEPRHLARIKKIEEWKRPANCHLQD